MLQSQVNYWNYLETQRHNLATEALTGQELQYKEITANASRMQAEVQQQLVPFEKMKAEASKSQADAALQQAQAALQNAETNRGNLEVNRENMFVNRQNADTNARNADTNRMNAYTNQWNAAINERNADTNWQNMLINQQNADINQQNANVNQQNADINQQNANTNLMVGTSNYNRNEAESALANQRKQTEEEKTKQEKINTQFSKPEHILGMINSGSQILNNFHNSNKKDNSISSKIISMLPALLP